MTDQAKRNREPTGKPPPLPPRPQMTEILLSAFVWAVQEALWPAVDKRRKATGGRPHWEDVVDMNAPAYPLKTNPSAWSHRITVAILACVGATLAGYMSLYQLHLIDSVWDPFFDGGTERMLTSKVADVMGLVFHVPDASLGATAYAAEIIFALAGSSRRWQYRPWLVLLFGLNVVGLAFVSAALVCSQGLIVHSWCFLCLITAAVSFSLFFLSIEEVYACLHYLWRVWQRSAGPLVVFDTFLGRASRYAQEVAIPEATGR
jgi:uncharacterized membrane protein